MPLPTITTSAVSAIEIIRSLPRNCSPLRPGRVCVSYRNSFRRTSIAGGPCMKTKPDFDTTFEQLKGILKPYAAKLVVTADTSQNYMLDVNHVMKNKHRLFFAGVRVGKAYVSFHLMPVYTFSELRGD